MTTPEPSLMARLNELLLGLPPESPDSYYDFDFDLDLDPEPEPLSRTPLDARRLERTERAVDEVTQILSTFLSLRGQKLGDGHR